MSAEEPKLVEGQKKQQPKKTIRKKAKRKPAAARLRAAVDKTAAKECKAVADALVKNAKAGEVQSMKLLYSMARSAEERQESEGPHKLRNMAMELANSPQWKGDPATAQPSGDDD